MASFEQKSGVFVVRYDTPEALSPARQRDLETALRAAARERPVGIVFVVDPAVQMVDHTVPDYWLGITTDPAVRIAAIAVVTTRPAVSVSTRGFSAANLLRNAPVTVKPFPDEAAALAWVSGVVAGAGV